MFRRHVVDGMLAMRAPRPLIPAMMFRISRRVAGVPVSHSSRARGRSGYTLGRLGSLFSNLLINNSSLLLRLVGRMGILLACASFLEAGWTVYRKLVHGIAFQGWTSLFTALLFIGGMILFSLGVVGEYLLRIIELGESRPTYVVRQVTTGTPA
jgi:hypothetical protein